MKKFLALILALALIFSVGAVALANTPGDWFDEETGERLLITDWQGGGWLHDSAYPTAPGPSNGWITEEGDLAVPGTFGWHPMDIWTDIPRDDSNEFQESNSEFPKRISPDYQYMVYVLAFDADFSYYGSVEYAYGAVEINHLATPNDWWDGEGYKWNLRDILEYHGIDFTILPDGYINLVLDKGNQRLNGLSFCRWSDSINTTGNIYFKEAYLTNDPPAQWSAYEDINWVESGSPHLALRKNIVLQLDNPYAVLNGVRVKIDPYSDLKPIISDGRTLMPLRFTAEKFGAQVDWLGVINTAAITRGNNHLLLPIDSTIVYKNFQPYLIDVPAQIINFATMVPLRATGELLGLYVEYDHATQVILISEKPITPQILAAAVEQALPLLA